VGFRDSLHGFGESLHFFFPGRKCGSTFTEKQRTVNQFLAYITFGTIVPVLRTIRIKELAVIP